MTKFENVAHLYLGCPVIIDPNTPNSVKGKLAIVSTDDAEGCAGKMSVLLDDDAIYFTDDSGNMVHENDESFFEKIESAIDEAMQLYAQQKWDETCIAQQRLIIDAMLKKEDATEKQDQSHIDVLRLFAEKWNKTLAPLPTFKA